MGFSALKGMNTIDLEINVLYQLGFVAEKKKQLGFVAEQKKKKWFCLNT